MTMTMKDAKKADTYRLQRVTTPENLQMRMMHNGGSILNFGSYVLVAGYYYNPNGRSYYGVLYRYTTTDYTCEGEIELVSISDDTFADNGHAIAWAMSKAK